MADDDAAHRRRDDDARSATGARRDRRGERLGQRRGARGVHQHPRALQIERAAQARGEDEMALQQRAGGAEFGQDFLFGHRFSWLECPPTDREQAAGHQAFRQRGATCLRDANPLPIRRRASAPGRPNPAARRAGHRGLDEDFFEAVRHRRRLRPGARRRRRPGRRRRAASAAAHRRRARPAAPAAADATANAAGAARRAARAPRRRPASASPTAATACRSRSARSAWKRPGSTTWILMPVITVISLFVLALLGWVIVPLSPRRQSDAVAQHPQYDCSKWCGRWCRC